MKFNLSAFLQWRFNIYLFRKLGWAAAYMYIALLFKLYFFFKTLNLLKIKINNGWHADCTLSLDTSLTKK